jgi:hypothetical protein
MFGAYLLFFQHSFQSAFNLLLIYKKDVRHILLLKIELQQPYEMGLQTVLHGSTKPSHQVNTVPRNYQGQL